MSAKHALLGLLLDRPAYPYELADRLQSRLGPAWEINSGQVYQTIKAMEAEGLIKRVDRTPRARDQRHIYAITEGGIEEFERWFEATTKGVRLPRRPLLVKITLAGPERLQEALEQIDAYELDCTALLGELLHVREESPVEGPLVRADQVLFRLNVSAEIRHVEAELASARHARETVSWLRTQQAVWPSGSDRAGDAVEEARRSARTELFGQMAARDLGDPPRPPNEADRDG